MRREEEREVIYRFVREVEKANAWFFWDLGSDGLDDFELDAIVERTLQQKPREDTE